MKKKFVKWIAMLLLIAGIGYSTVSLTMAYSGSEPTLVYNGSSHSFSYLNTDGENLFTEFSDLMPGDTRTQTFLLQGTGLSTETTFYLKATVPSGDEDLLKQMTMSISADGTKVSSGTAAEEHLASDVKLVSLPKDGTSEITVSLSVPTSLGNELSDFEQQSVWTITAQEADAVVGDVDTKKPSSDSSVTPSTKTSGTKTAFAANWKNWALLAGCALMLIVLLFVKDDEDKEEQSC